MIMFMIVADGPTSNEHDGWHGMVNIHGNNNHDYDMLKVMITKVMTTMVIVKQEQQCKVLHGEREQLLYSL